jgi:hypothetical protein
MHPSGDRGDPLRAAQVFSLEDEFAPGDASHGVSVPALWDVALDIC